MSDLSRVIKYLDRLASLVERLADTAPDDRDRNTARTLAIDVADFFNEKRETELGAVCVEVSKLEYREGDTVVVKIPEDWATENRKQIAEHIASTFPAFRFLFIPKSVELSVVARPTQGQISL